MTDEKIQINKKTEKKTQRERTRRRERASERETIEYFGIIHTNSSLCGVALFHVKCNEGKPLDKHKISEKFAKIIFH